MTVIIYKRQTQIAPACSFLSSRSVVINSKEFKRYASSQINQMLHATHYSNKCYTDLLVRPCDEATAANAKQRIEAEAVN